MPPCLLLRKDINANRGNLGADVIFRAITTGAANGGNIAGTHKNGTGKC
jgi:hypothetical protein